MPRVRSCAQHPTDLAGAVGIKVTGSGADRRAGFSGLAVCGSVWSCPVCAAKVTAARQSEVEQAIATWEASGGAVYMLTLTMRHKRGQRLKTLWDGVSKAWAGVTSGRAWVQEQETYSIAGWLRVVEVTRSDANGWHVHVHALIFVRESQLLPGFSALDLGPTMFQRWRKRLIGLGFGAPSLRRGVDMRRGGKGLGGYFAKHSYSDKQTATAWELVGGSGKTGASGSRTPFRILADVVQDGDADDLALWHEWERASQGRRQLTWSRGLRDQLRLLPELSDQEAAEADDLLGEVVAIIARDLWFTVWRWHSGRLLEAAEADDGGAGLRSLLESGP